jgi:hypothetical protein
MNTTTDPGSSPSQTVSAPASVAPPVMPQKMPSFVASSRDSLSASAPPTPTMRSTCPASIASPVSFGMKSGA